MSNETTSSPADAKVIAADDMSAVHSTSFGLHTGVIGLMLGAYVYMILMFWLMFGHQVDSAFVVGVSTGFLAIYAGLPILMFRMAGVSGDGARFGDFLHGKTDTNTGAVSGVAALMQVLTVPIALAIGATGFALILFIRG